MEIAVAKMNERQLARLFIMEAALKRQKKLEAQQEAARKRDDDLDWVKKNFGLFLEKLGNQVEVKMKHPEGFVQKNWESGIHCRRTSPAHAAAAKEYDDVDASIVYKGNTFYYNGTTMPWRHAACIALLRLLPPWNNKANNKVYTPAWVVHYYGKFKKILDQIDGKSKTCKTTRKKK